METEEITINGRTTKDGRWSIEDVIMLGFDTCFPEDAKNLEIKSPWGRSRYVIPTHCFGFYDWFCKDYSLRGKAKKLFANAISLVMSDKCKHFNPLEYYVSLKNNCPCTGSLYDCLRFFPYDDNKTSFIISFKEGRVLFETTIGSKELEFSTFTELKDWFVNNFNEEDFRDKEVAV